MENDRQVVQPNEKKSKDLLKLIIGIVAVIVALILLKYLAGALGLI